MTAPAQEPEGSTLLYKDELIRGRETALQNPSTQLVNDAVSRDELLGPWTVCFLIANRTIASGIFTQPYNVVTKIGNPGASLFLWFVAGVIILCITACWVELGLNIPRHVVKEGEPPVSTPKSGGDKNYLEYIFKSPDFLMSCVFGITFLIFGNLAGNAIQFGIYMQAVADPHCQDDCVRREPVVGWAVVVLTLCALINVATRKFSIYLNNGFAIVKLSLVVLMVFIGMGYGATHGDGCRKIVWENKGEGGHIGDVILALFYAMYPYTGYEQPFYVLAEVKKPKRLFARSVLFTMASFIILYVLINTSYLCMNPYEGANDADRASSPHFSTNTAINFFHKLAENNPAVRQEGIVSGVSFVLALFIFGNLLAQTYTASRVKNEIAKEGILPRSLFFAAMNDTLFARWLPARYGGEQAPFAATALHWGVEVFLVLVVGLSLPPNKAYNFLTYIYTYVIVGILGFLTVSGLLYLKIDSWWRPKPRAIAVGTDGQRRHVGRGWNEKRKGNDDEMTPWLDPLPCVVAVLALALLLFGAFAKPSSQGANDLAWYIGPLVGWCSLLAGVAWWQWREFQQRQGRYRIKRKRFTYVDNAGGDLVQIAERVTVRKEYASENRPFDEMLLRV